MKRRNLLKNICIMMAAMLGLNSCGMVISWEEDMDVKQSIKFAGQWTGDFGMYYTYRHHGRLYTFDSYDTDIVFYPEYDGATHGYGKQVDYYERGPYEYIYNRFNWEIRNGIVYLQYHSDPSLDCAIYDYKMTADRFQGRFGSSNDRFYLTKIADYYDWTVYMDYYYYYPNNNWYWSPRYAMENGKTKTENGNLRVSESRSKVDFDSAEREQIQYDKVGLKRKTGIGKLNDNGNQWDPELKEADGIVSYGKRM